MEVFIIGLCALVIGFIVYRYERKLEKLQMKYTDLVMRNINLITSGEKLIFDYSILVDLLLEKHTEEELGEMFARKKSEKFKEFAEVNENEQ